MSDHNPYRRSTAYHLLSREAARGRSERFYGKEPGLLFRSANPITYRENGQPNTGAGPHPRIADIDGNGGDVLGLRTRESFILEYSGYFRNVEAAGRCLNRIAHKSEIAGLNGSSVDVMRNIARLAVRFEDDSHALVVATAIYEDMVRNGAVSPRDLPDTIQITLEKRVTKVLNGAEIKDPGRIPILL